MPGPSHAGRHHYFRHRSQRTKPVPTIITKKIPVTTNTHVGCARSGGGTPAADPPHPCRKRSSLWEPEQRKNLEVAPGRLGLESAQDIATEPRDDRERFKGLEPARTFARRVRGDHRCLGRSARPTPDLRGLTTRSVSIVSWLSESVVASGDPPGVPCERPVLSAHIH